MKRVCFHVVIIVLFYLIGWYSHQKLGKNNIIEEMAEAGLRTEGVTIDFSDENGK